MTDLHEMVSARCGRHTPELIAIALVEIYNAFLDGATREQAVGTLTHRGVKEHDAVEIFELVQKLTA